MWSNNQVKVLMANGGGAISDCPALAMNGLAWGSNLTAIWTRFESLHRINLGDIYLTHYHFDDDAHLKKIDDELNVYLPTPDRCLIDAVKFVEKSYDEGVFIEAMQNYLRKHKDLSELYAVADHYNVPKADVDYWIAEALEESDMSMG